MGRAWSLALLLACLTVAGIAVPASAALAEGPASGVVRGAVVVVGVPDLRWQDVDPGVTPTLWGLADTSSVAGMTDRSGEGVTGRAAGWVTVNTGTRAVARAEPGIVPDPTAPEQLQALRDANRSARYAADVGALGDALHGAGIAVAGVGGPGAELAAMDSTGTVAVRAPSVADALLNAGVVFVELPQLYDVDRRDAGAVHDALTAIDEQVGTILQELPTNATLLVAGVSDGAFGRAHLHVAMAKGPSFGPGLLTSPSTGRVGVVQLIDLAPTILGLTGTPVPPSMLGVHWQAVPGTGVSTARQVSDLVELDRRSVTARAAVAWYYPVVVLTALLFVAATVIGWTRRRTGLLRPLGAVVAGVPVAGYLVQVVPWWRAGSWPLAPLTLGFATALGLAASCTPWARRDPWHTPAVVGGVTAAVIVLDAATGSPLSLDAPFADNPIIAGRFHGIGNVAFALLGAGTLVLAAALARGRGSRRAAATVFGLGAVAVVVDGLPALGDDFGGVLALLPAVAVLGLVVAGVRPTGRYVLAVVVVTVATTAGFAVYDYSRPPALRTHLGRFVAQIADGTAGSVVGRKLGSSLATVTSGWPRWIVVGWLVLAVVAYVGHRTGKLRVAGSVDRRTAGGLMAALLVLGVLGAALNDSGVEVMAFAFYLAAPLLVPMIEPVPEQVPTTPRQHGVGAPGFSRS